uniref:Uncharacterized protein n=1 Tax=Glycine max TaxID=3847 RepID=C6TEU6_SOYBN|nr:unknown [Glycine max]
MSLCFSNLICLLKDHRVCQMHMHPQHHKYQLEHMEKEGYIQLLLLHQCKSL